MTGSATAEDPRGRGPHPLLVAAFRRLDEAGIPWALLRGADRLDDPQGDVDLLVRAPGEAALEALRAAGFRVVPGRGRLPHRFAHAVDPATGRWLELDVVDAIAFGPWQQLTTRWAAEVLARRRRIDGVWRLDPRDEAWLYALHQILDKRRPQRARGVPLAATDPVPRLLDHACGPGTGGRVVAALQHDDPTAVAGLPGLLQRSWVRPAVLYWRVLRARLLRLLHDGGRWHRGDGRMVAVLGPDGAGKSSLIAALRTAGFPVAVSEVYFGLWRENAWDLRLGRLPGARFGLRILRALRQALRARLARWRGRLVLLDRSPYDALIGEAAGSLGGRLLGGFALAITPRPDLVVLLDAPGEVMFARKGEDTVELLEWRREQYLALQTQVPQMVVLDATRPPADVQLAATSAVWRGMAAPGRKRPGVPRPARVRGEGPTRARTGPGDPLRAWRRLDWQFLLTRPMPHVVALGGRPDEGLAASLADVAGCRTTTPERADLLVLLDPDRRELADQLRRARPGSEVYVELRGSPRRGLWGWGRLARDAGLRNVRVHWHVLGGGRRTRIVPLHDRRALLDTLARHDAIRFGWLKWVVARALLGLGLLPFTLRHGSITGVVGGERKQEPSALEALVWDVAASSFDHPVPPAGTVLVTPSDATSRHVVALAFAQDAAAPRVVAKVPRRVGDVGGVRREAELLPRLVEQAPDLRAAVPQVLALARLGDHDALITTALDGRPLSPARVRRDVTAAVAAGARFTAALPVTGSADDAWCASHLDQPLAELVRGSGSALPGDILERTAALLAPLRGAGLPTVFEHGDLSDPNLLVRPDGSLQVLDWERADEFGLPGHDLVQFLAYLGDARRAATTPAARREAFDAAFVGRDAWTRPILDEHLAGRGVAPELRPLLVLSCWARTSATLVPRVLAAHPAGAATPEHFGAVVAQEPDVARWLRCLDRFADL